MTEINHAGYYMNTKPKPEVILYDTDAIIMRPIRLRKEPHHTFVVTIVQPEKKLTTWAKDILISEEVGCRLIPTMDREFNATKLVFTDQVKCVVRDYKIVVVPMLED